MSWLLHDVRWAWRGVIGRGWRAPLIIGLLTAAIAANTAVFTVADALVFDPFPYDHPERVVTLNETLPDGAHLTKAQAATRLLEWRKQTDIFDGVGGYVRKTVFLTAAGMADKVPTADMTIGFLDVLGVKPGWGRPFVSGDESASEFAVLLSPRLARKYFGDPMRALGQVLETTAGPHRVVGVMPEGFAYPSATYEMWRALDPEGPLARNFGAIGGMARITAGMPEDRLPRLLAERALAVGTVIGQPSYAVTVSPALQSARTGPGRTLVLVLLGAALCLLLATCANVASLELAAAIGRTRTYAVQLALGASRASLARVAALEGAILIGAALLCGIGIASLSSAMLMALLPEWLRMGGQHRIGIDARSVVYTTIVAGGAWVFAALPPVIAASRPNLLALLRLADRTAATSRTGVRLRQMLTTAQVAVAVTLIIAGLLYTRSYRELLTVEKGFNSEGLAELSWIVPSGHFHSSAERADAMGRLKSKLASVPGVEAITQSAPPPNLGDSPGQVALEVDDRPPLDKPVLIGAKWVDVPFFSVIQLPIRAGRVFLATDLASDVVVSETFARRFWPDGDAVGHAFRRRPQEPWYHVVGVVGDFRSARMNMPSVSDRQFLFYRRVAVTPPPTGPSTPPSIVVDDGGSFGYISLTVRMSSAARTAAVLTTAQSFDPKLRATLDMVDDMYADQNADTRLASQVVGGFSVLAFLAAIAGVYGLMAFLVSSRLREIGVRIALGASPGDISRLILGSSARLVATGAALGAIAAVTASRWIESALFGITGTDPATYVAVVLLVIISALAATWQPARHASRVDPARMLRAD